MAKNDDAIKFLLADYVERMHYKRLGYIETLEVERSENVKIILAKAIKGFSANIKRAEELLRSFDTKSPHRSL